MKEAVTKVIDILTQKDFDGAFQKFLEKGLISITVIFMFHSFSRALITSGICPTIHSLSFPLLIRWNLKIHKMASSFFFLLIKSSSDFLVWISVIHLFLATQL